MIIFNNKLSYKIAQNIAWYLAYEAIGQVGLNWGCSSRLSRVIALVFNLLITKDSFIAENLEMIFILPFVSRHKRLCICIAGYILTIDDEYSVHHGHIWAVLQCVE